MNKLGTVITGLASLFSFSSFAANSLKTKTINVTKVVADFIAVERGDLVRSNDLVEYIDRNFTDFEVREMERKIGFDLYEMDNSEKETIRDLISAGILNFDQEEIEIDISKFQKKLKHHMATMTTSY